MKPHPNYFRRPARKLLACALLSCLAMVAAPAAFAQSTAATIRGQVTVDAAPAPDARVTATNVATGFVRTVQAGSDGSYSLAGLPPGAYRIDVTAGGQTGSQVVTVRVGETATLNLSTGGDAPTASARDAVDLGGITVTAPLLFETKTSEIASYVSNRQIQALPQASRNFLAFADIVPGVVFNTGTDGSTSLRSGPQQSAGINVFIDGVGQKDYVLKGGISGQDSSRGNPFPQLGIAEYKVITSNYKAEFDQLSSAAITAVTQSGTNEFHGDFFWDYTSDKWTSKTIREEKGARKAQSKNEQYGVSFGGPIIQDRMHFFLAYEGKEFDSPRTVRPGRDFPVEQLPTDLQQLVRDTTSAPFQEDLFFGKIDWAIGDNHLVELTGKYRDEDELTNVGGINTAPYGTLKVGEETRVDLRYQYSASDWLNDAHLTYEDTTFGPSPATLANGFNLRIPRRGQEANDSPDMEDILNAGGGGDLQDKGQRGISFQDDFTYFGLQGHTIKAGMKYKDVDISAFEQQPFTPQFRYDILRSLTVPYEVFFTASGNNLPGKVESSSKQFGLYIQDDWDVTERLQMNLGVRWDYEQTPSFEDHVTPAALVTALRNFPNINNANVDYNINDYIGTGSNRSAFKDAFQPRLGFSYDLRGDQRHVIFGGAGRSYNRNQFDFLQLEQNRLAFQRYTYRFNTPGHSCTPSATCFNFDPSFLDSETLAAQAALNPNNGSEVFLINNEIKTPYSDQFSLGMRNSFELLGQDWNSSATLVHVRSKDGILFAVGNRRVDGSFFPPGVTFGSSPAGFQLPGYGLILLGDNAIETRLNSVLLSLEKQYTNESRWGMTLAYTYSDAEENKSRSDVFTFDYPNLDNVGFIEATDIAKHRFVGTGIVELFAGLTFSSKLTLASPTGNTNLDCFPSGCDTGGFNTYYFDDQKFRQLDIALQKEWDTGTDLKLRIRGDVFNVTNARNYTDFDNWRGFNQGANPTFGQRNGDGILLPTRTFKLTLAFS
ncbi:MAG: TonB-dependent receptor, partial [Lysobacter sp.]